MNSGRRGALSAPALLALFLVTACGGGSGSAGGALNISTGEIIGFGSVIVNGIEFSRKTGLADDRVKLGFENISGTGESRLRAGMVVKVTGNFDSATGKGEYEEIEFQPELRGPLESVNEAAGTITVMGRLVQVEANSQLDGLRELAELTADLSSGRRPEVEISGYLENGSVLHATRIAREAPDFAGNGPVQIKGAIASVGAGGFTIGGVTVDSAGAVFTNMGAEELATGLHVEVKGQFNIATSTITAARIARKSPVEARQSDKVRIKGIAAGTAVGDGFTLNGPNGAITVKSGGAAFFKNGVAATPAIVTAGVRLEVEGALDVSGAVVATKVAVEIEKTVKLLGSLSARDNTAGTLTVNGVAANVISVTRFIDSSNARLSPFDAADVLLNDYVEVAGFIDASGKIVASQVQRFDLPVDRTFVQGPVGAKTADTMTVLGITVTVGAATRFENPDGSPFPGGQSAFLSAVVPNVTVVKARGAFTAPGSLDATAEEVQFGQTP